MRRGTELSADEVRPDTHVRIREVARDTFQLHLPVPIPGLSHVNVYAVRDGDEWALVDAGWPSEDAWTALKGALRQIGCTLDRVSAVWLTHLHPDHTGLADRFLELGVNVAAGASSLQERDGIFGRLSNVDASEWRRHGVPAELVSTLERERRWGGTPLPDSMFVLEDVDTLHLGERAFRVVFSPGHAAGHVSLFEEGVRLLFAGDHVLPTTTPHVGLLPGEAGNPLRDYLESLARVRRLPVSLVLPGHGDPFTDLAARVAAAEAHHAARLNDALNVVSRRPGATTYDVAKAMKWSIPWEAQDAFSNLQALTEALAHLVELERRGSVKRSGGAWKAEGRG